MVEFAVHIFVENSFFWTNLQSTEVATYKEVSDCLYENEPLSILNGLYGVVFRVS